MCPPHSLQHVLDRAFGLRELLCIAGAQHHIRVGPVLWVEERIAPDRNPRIGFGNLAEFARASAAGTIKERLSLALSRKQGFESPRERQ